MLILQLGTCAMKPRAFGGVVDPRLNVYGVENLKVAGEFVCPSTVDESYVLTSRLQT